MTDSPAFDRMVEAAATAVHDASVFRASDGHMSIRVLDDAEAARLALTAALATPAKKPCPECLGDPNYYWSPSFPAPGGGSIVQDVALPCCTCGGSGSLDSIPAVVEWLIETGVLIEDPNNIPGRHWYRLRERKR